MVENKFLVVIDEIKKMFPQIVALYKDDELLDIVHFLWRLGEIEYETQEKSLS
jgi:hypothetical protein